MRRVAFLLVAVQVLVNAAPNLRGPDTAPDILLVRALVRGATSIPFVAAPGPGSAGLVGIAVPQSPPQTSSSDTADKVGTAEGVTHHAATTTTLSTADANAATELQTAERRTQSLAALVQQQHDIVSSGEHLSLLRAAAPPLEVEERGPERAPDVAERDHTATSYDKGLAHKTAEPFSAKCACPKPYSAS